MVLPHPGHRDNQISPGLQSGLQGTSTSGPPSAIDPVGQDLEIDALIRVQSEKIRSGVAEMRKRHCQALISILEQREEKRLKQIEAELESVRRKNAEMEEKARQIEAKSKMCFNVAKNNKAIAAKLRATLEKALLLNAALRWRITCKACGVREVAFLLLPCRHLCVCEFCDSMIDTCPICHSSKQASFQIFMS